MVYLDVESSDVQHFAGDDLRQQGSVLSIIRKAYRVIKKVDRYDNPTNEYDRYYDKLVTYINDEQHAPCVKRFGDIILYAVNNQNERLMRSLIVIATKNFLKHNDIYISAINGINALA